LTIAAASQEDDRATTFELILAGQGSIRQLAERVLAQPHHTLSPPAAQLLDGLIADPPRTPGGGYELPLEQMALVQMGMIRHLARHGARLDQALQHWLGL